MSEWTRFGDPATIEIAIRWVDDPEPQGRRPARYGWSMGQLELKVAGISVTATTLNGARQPYVGWYLSPFLDWLATNWASLLHEERFPWPNRSNAPAAIACNRALDEWMAAEDPQGQENYAQAQGWYFKHGLRAAAAGGIFPDLFIRRFADDIELSWSGAPMEFTQAGLAFESGAGQARLPVREVAETVWSALQWAVNHPPKSSAQHQDDIAALKQKVESLRRVDEEAMASAHASPEVLETARTILGGIDRLDLLEYGRPAIDSSVSYMAELPPAVAMFGGVSPQLSVPDVKYLCNALTEGLGGGDGAELAVLVADRQGTTLGVPYRDAVRFADDLLEDMALEDGDFINVRAMCRRLEIEIHETLLDTDSIRGAALAGDELSPRIVVNGTHYFNQNESGKRFTIAHELCHVLFDRTRARRIAHVSGPWAAPGIEQRANAFAAYLLMPRALIFAHLRDANHIDRAEVQRLANRLQVNESALVEHLRNLGIINDVDRAKLIDEIGQARQRRLESR